ncbi:putative integral membrane protein conserved region-domain-containing protein [Gongronella butleri]|nr:putative integral membrane protein conserved region-domain-containing protein [Gongronella butleri]
MHDQVVEKDQTRSVRKRRPSLVNSLLAASSSASLRTNGHHSAALAPQGGASVLYYAVLRHGTLFCFDSEQQRTCHVILPMHDYTLSLYPNGKTESELYGRSTAIRLAPKEKTTHKTYYLTCRRPIDKEDWYVALVTATQLLLGDDKQQLAANAHAFDAHAMEKLQYLLQGNAARREMQWWNALLGRVFLGVYKTDDWREFWEKKIKTKLDRLSVASELHAPHDNTMPHQQRFGLRPFQVQSVDAGDSIPCLTEPRLISLDANGQWHAQAHIHYDASFTLVIRTELYYLWGNHDPLSAAAAADDTQTTTRSRWPKQASIPLLLSVTLKHLSGKMVFKIKPPPSNRVWFAFDALPEMDWQVTPVVMDKQIKWSLVSHLIQAKIKDWLTNGLVVPNFEDIPFCDSHGAGGIFADALRDAILPVSNAEDDPAPAPRAATPPSPSPSSPVAPSPPPLPRRPTNTRKDTVVPRMMRHYMDRKLSSALPSGTIVKS